jgi:hypothetical protein
MPVSESICGVCGDRRIWFGARHGWLHYSGGCVATEVPDRVEVWERVIGWFGGGSAGVCESTGRRPGRLAE